MGIDFSSLGQNNGEADIYGDQILMSIAGPRTGGLKPCLAIMYSFKYNEIVFGGCLVDLILSYL